jgi:hypothetical protein
MIDSRRYSTGGEMKFDNGWDELTWSVDSLHSQL